MTEEAETVLDETPEEVAAIAADIESADDGEREPEQDDAKQEKRLTEYRVLTKRPEDDEWIVGTRVAARGQEDAKRIGYGRATTPEEREEGLALVIAVVPESSWQPSIARAEVVKTTRVTLEAP